MAFTQKSKFTSSGLMNRMPGKAKLINNSKTAFHQEKTCTEYDIVNGEKICVGRFSTRTFADDQGLGYQTVYDKLPTNEDGNRVNPKTGAIYTDVSQFEADAKGSRKIVEARDVTKGATTTFDKDLYDQLLSHKKRGDIDGWKKYLSDRNIDMDGEPFKKFIKKAKITRNNEIVRKKREEDKKKKLPTKAEWCTK